MAISKCVAVMVLLFLAIICLSECQVLTDGTDTVVSKNQRNGNGWGPGSLKSYQCSGACQTRCSQTQHKKPCLVFCNKCCVKCLCVPPGYYGNKQYCPCYNNWKTKRGSPKCP